MLRALATLLLDGGGFFASGYAARMAKRHLYTVGYEGLSVGDFLDLLRGAGVEVLADVRDNPFSRKAGFSKKPLTEAVTAAGIEYQSWRSLGAPKPIRDRIKADNDWRAYTAGYFEHLEAEHAEVARLTALAEARTVCLVCYEADANRRAGGTLHAPSARPARRHRRYVADAVQAAGGPLPMHLKAAGPQAALPL
ncbi:MAG: DUF488 domain-containing protein [Alphaproteobacteria bacterium]|nr:DUF488 domain-containing protein [Alphaproteobacteria bacterium]